MAAVRYGPKLDDQRTRRHAVPNSVFCLLVAVRNTYTRDTLAIQLSSHEDR